MADERMRTGSWIAVSSDREDSPDSVSVFEEGDERVSWFRVLEEDEQLADMLEYLGAVITEYDAEGNTVEVSSSVRETLGYEPADLVGSPSHSYVHPEDVARTTALRLDEEGSPPQRNAIHRARHVAGHWVWLETSATEAFRAADGTMHGMAFSRDVTREQQVDELIRENAERYSVVLEANEDSIIESDLQGRVRFMTPNLGASLGYSAQELALLEPHEIVHPDDFDLLRRQFAEAIENLKPVRLDAYRARHRDGGWRWLQSTGIAHTASGGQRRFLNVTRDITERLELMQERIDRDARAEQIKRLERLGGMAGGMAHDFNNLLTPIIGETTLVLADLPEGSALRPRLMRIVETARRAAEIVRPMLGYAGGEDIEPQRMGLSSFVEEAAPILEATIGSKYRLALELDPEDPVAIADPSSLLQVLLNLVTNAAESNSEPGASLFVRTGRGEMREQYAVPELSGEQSLCSWVFLEVEDQGEGMSAELQTRVFDPFFTTKPSGRGLGLASVIGILRSHGGGTEVESEVGVGTRVRAFVPAANREGGVASLPSGGVVGDSGERGVVLVVDDDPGTRELIADVLTRASFEVLLAADGAEGVRRLKENVAQVRLVLLDRVMPGQSRAETVADMTAVNPGIPILEISGFADREDWKRSETSFLAKPFSPDELLRVVRLLVESS